MATLRTKFIALSEAKAFLEEAKALPLNSSTFERLHRCSRASVLMSWVALEAMVEYELTKLGCSKSPKGLRARIELLATQRQVSLDKGRYLEQRELRNRVTHPDDTFVWHSPDAATAERAFNYCLELISQLYSIKDPWY